MGGAESDPHPRGWDLNAHSNLWGSATDTARGFRVEKLLFDYVLTCTNEGEVPTFVTGKASTIIDLTLVSPICEEYISHWGVITKHGEVDHRPVETRYFPKKPAQSTGSP